MLACSVGDGIWLELFVRIASCVSGASVYLLFKLRMSFHSLVGCVRCVIVSRGFSRWRVVRVGYPG